MALVTVAFVTLSLVTLGVVMLAHSSNAGGSGCSGASGGSGNGGGGFHCRGGGVTSAHATLVDSHSGHVKLDARLPEQTSASQS